MYYNQLVNSPNLMLEVAKGNVDGYSMKYIQGVNPDIDITIEEVCDTGAVSTYPTSAEALFISSSDNGDTHDILIIGLDANYDIQTETITLNGQTSVESAFTWLRIFLMENTDSTNLAGTVYSYTTDTIEVGVNVTPAKRRAVITSPYNRNNNTAYTVPAGYSALLLEWHIGTISDTATKCTPMLKTREFGKVFQIIDIGKFDEASEYEHKFRNKLLSEKTDIVATCTTSVENISIKAHIYMILIDNTYLVV